MISARNGTWRDSDPSEGRGHPVAIGKPQFEHTSRGEIVRVPLSGKHGVGRAATLDAHDWRRLSAIYGTKWVRMVTVRDPWGRIVTGRVAAVAAAREMGASVGIGPSPLVSLARLVAEAAADDRVFVRDGDPFNLRFINLDCVSNATIAAFMANLHPRKRALLAEVG